MTDRNAPLRGLILAIAFFLLAPLTVAGALVATVDTARAQQGPVIASVLFEGNMRFTDAQLMAMVNSSTGRGYNPAAAQQDAETIRLAYERAGYTGVNVGPRAESLDDGRVRVTFVVNEGDRAGIAGINFTGNNTFGAGTLKGVITSRETHLLSWLFNDDIYDEDRLTLDRELIRQHYINRGFPDAQVLSAVAEFDPQRNAYFVSFTISEGERYTISGVDVQTSIPGLNVDPLRGAIRTHPGNRFSAADLQRSTEDIAFRATGQGYSFADVRPRLNRDIANRTFHVTYLVDEGTRLYVERINITGNTKTRDFVIRRELDFAEGDPFNRSMVTRGRSNIEGLDFFESVNISTTQGSGPDQVVINIAVVEKSTGEYGASVGYSTEDGVLGEVSLTERNFLGRGQYLRIAVGATGSGQTFDVSFTEPRFMGLRISAGVDVYHRINRETMNNYYGSTATGGQLRVGVPLTDDLTATVFTGFEHRVITDNFVDDDGSVSPFSSLVSDGDEFNRLSVGYTLTYNTLDNQRRPTEGLLATFTQQYVGLDHNYIRTEARARYFMPLLDDTGVVGSIRGTAGIINDLGDDGVHPIESFRLGPSLVRGFQGGGIGPRLRSGEVLGATAYVGGSVEVDFPLPIVPENYGLRGAVWADAAIVEGLPGQGTGSGYDPDRVLGLTEPLRASIGASLIWDSPFGPLRGDFAHVLSQDEADRTQVFALSISTLL